jgi:hypothetical protein
MSPAERYRVIVEKAERPVAAEPDEPVSEPVPPPKPGLPGELPGAEQYEEIEPDQILF